MTLQKTPWTYSNCCTRPLGGKQNRGTHGEHVSGEVVAGWQGRRGGKARGRRGQPVDVLGVGWDGREGDPPRRATGSADGKPRQRASEALGGGERAGELHCGKRMRFPGSFGVEEDRRWGLRCAAVAEWHTSARLVAARPWRAMAQGMRAGGRAHGLGAATAAQAAAAAQASGARA